MAIIEGTKENFAETVKDGITLIDFWAEWCGPCKQFGPIFEKASEKHPDVKFMKIDTEDQMELAQSANISSIPTVMAIKEGHLFFSQPGVLGASQLDELIAQMKSLVKE